MLDIQKMVAAINAGLADLTKDRVVFVDIEHVYWFKNGVDQLSPSGLRATQLAPFDIEAIYHKLRQRRIDAALARVDDELRAAGAGSAAKTATGYAVTEGGKTSELNETDFITSARARNVLARDDPFFV